MEAESDVEEIMWSILRSRLLPGKASAATLLVLASSALRASSVVCESVMHHLVHHELQTL